jgi:hypothetical protein
MEGRLSRTGPVMDQKEARNLKSFSSSKAAMVVLLVVLSFSSFLTD